MNYEKRITSINELARLVVRTMASKEDLVGLATKEDLTLLATKEDLAGVKTELKADIQRVENRLDGDIRRVENKLNAVIDRELPVHDRRISRVEKVLKLPKLV